MVNKLDKLKLNIAKQKPTFVFITETWLKDAIDSSIIDIQGYNLFRNDRKGRMGGGVCMMVKEEIDGQPIHSTTSEKYTTEGNGESIWVDVQINNITLLLSCIYRPNYTTVEENNCMINEIKRAFR